MVKESEELSKIKYDYEKNIGYQKIIGKKLINVASYTKDSDIYYLIAEFITTEEFLKSYESYTDIDKETVAIYILKGMISLNNAKIIEIENFLWNKYQKGYKKLLELNFNDPSIYFNDLDCKKLIKAFMKTDEYQKLFDETKEYMELIKKNWSEDKEKINKFLKEILRIDINIKPTVYISHPDTCQGQNFADNKIVWGHYRGISDLNYNLVYLIHEGLHCLLPFQSDFSNEKSYILHAIIELISDYELYSFLSNKSTLNEGHNYLVEYKKAIYPYWLEYIGLTDQEKHERTKKDNVSISYSDKKALKLMNILQFLDFCVVNVSVTDV